MVKKTLLLTALLLVVLSVAAFAGEGSDTIGACKLMPELRYSYFETPMISHDLTTIDGTYFDWRTKEHSVVAQLTWGVIDNLDLYTFVGARVHSSIDGTREVTAGDNRLLFDFGTGFTCGLGVKGTFWRSPGGFYLGGGTSVTYSVTTGKNPAKGYLNSSLLFNSLDGGFYYYEQNLAAVADLHVGWHIGNTGLTPYLGVEYRWNKAYVREMLDGVGRTDDFIFRAENPVGVYVGLDYLINDRLSLNLEGHMINRWGGTFAVGYKFDICGRPAPVPPALSPAPPIEPKLEPMSKN